MALPQAVPGTEGALAWVDLSLYRDRRDPKALAKFVAAFDRVSELGSGPAPFREPYYHVDDVYYESETRYREANYGLYYDSYGNGYRETGVGRKWRTDEVRKVPYTVRVKKNRVALSPALNKATAVGVAAVTKTNFPIVEYRWFLANALVEPRYHELLGLDDSEASVLKLADANERKTDDLGAQLRGAVLFSEVAHRNRLLERTPTRLKYGRGSFHRSFDFKTSLAAQDVLKDTLTVNADAHEIIWTLPNGLQGYYVSDAKGKRLDKADADIAISRRGRWHDPQVRTAFVCMDCHLRQKGWIEVDDEVREYAKKEITLAVSVFEKGEKDRGRRVRQKFLQADFNELLQADQTVVETAVRAATGGKAGLTCAETAREVMESIAEYLQEPVTLAQLARELGVPQARLVRAIEKTPGLDHALVGLRINRTQRRDQTEQIFGQIATVLYLGGGK